MEYYYYIFEIKYYDDDDYKERHERGIICAQSKGAIVEKLENYFGARCIFDLRIYDVNMDTEEILFERNFPGIIEMMENPKED